MAGNFSFTVFEQMYKCYNSTAGAISLTVFGIINITFILPLCIFVIYLGLQQWQQQTSNTPMSHCDVFTYNMVLIDLIQVIGSMLSCYSINADISGLISAGICMLSFYLSGQMLFFSLTCVDCYLAVVFPIIYLNLKKPKFIRARNITIGCIWLCSVIWLCLLIFVEYTQMITFLAVITTLLLLFIVFSCFSVLYVLTRPGPGEGGRHQDNQSKGKAFNTMIRILAVVTFRFMGVTISYFIYNFANVKEATRCAVWLALVCNGLPCSLLQPILFLQKTGKLTFWKNNK